MNPAYTSEIDQAASSLIAWLMATGYAIFGVPWYSYALMAVFSVLYGIWRVQRISRRLA